MKRKQRKKPYYPVPTLALKRRHEFTQQVDDIIESQKVSCDTEHEITRDPRYATVDSLVDKMLSRKIIEVDDVGELKKRILQILDYGNNNVRNATINVPKNVNEVQIVQSNNELSKKKPEGFVDFFYSGLFEPKR